MFHSFSILNLLLSLLQNFDVLNGIAWDKENNRIFGKLLIILLSNNNCLANMIVLVVMLYIVGAHFCV